MKKITWRESYKTKLPRALDRRVKLTERDKEEIKRQYQVGIPVRKIARNFEGKCSRRLIQFILFPERAQHAADLFKERRLDGRYYPDRDKWAATMREHRRYKVNALNKNEKQN